MADAEHEGVLGDLEDANTLHDVSTWIPPFADVTDALP